jgi:hypothetical protein
MNITKQLKKAATHEQQALVYAVILFGRADLNDEDKALLASIIDSMDVSLKLLDGTGLHTLPTAKEAEAIIEYLEEFE